MAGHDHPTTLFRIEPERNMQRFYSVTIQRNLFGGHSVMRNWGRIGTGGQMQIDLFESELTARCACDQLLQAKVKRGYSD